MPRNRGRGLTSWGGFLTPLNLDVASIRVRIAQYFDLVGHWKLERALEGQFNLNRDLVGLYDPAKELEGES